MNFIWNGIDCKTVEELAEKYYCIRSNLLFLARLTKSRIFKAGPIFKSICFMITSIFSNMNAFPSISYKKENLKVTTYYIIKCSNKRFTAMNFFTVTNVFHSKNNSTN